MLNPIAIGMEAKMYTDRKNLTWCTIDGILATPWTLIMLPASFLMSSLLTVYYGISPQVFGAIVSIPFWCNALQIVAVPVVARFMTVRELILSMAWLNVGLCAMLSLLTFVLPADGSQRLGWFFAGFFIMASASMSMMVLGWQTWVKDVVPERIRGVFFGKRNRWASVSSLFFLFLSMGLLKWSGNELWAFQVLITLAVAMRAGSVLVLHLIHPPAGRVWTETISTAWIEDLRELVRDRVFMRFVLFGALFGFWNGAIGAYVPVYLLGYLEFSPSQFAACTIIATITGGFSLPTWGRLCDRFGSVRVAIVSLIVWRVWDFLWMVVTPELNWMLYAMWAVGGLVGSGFLLAMFNVLLEVTPRSKSVAGMSLNLCITSVAAALAPLLAGVWVGIGEAREWSDPVIYRTLLAFCFAGCLVAVPVLLKMPARKADAPAARHAFGAMRTARQQLMSAGLAFLGNVSLVARPWRRSVKRRRRRR